MVLAWYNIRFAHMLGILGALAIVKKLDDVEMKLVVATVHAHTHMRARTHPPTCTRISSRPYMFVQNPRKPAVAECDLISLSLSTPKRQDNRKLKPLEKICQEGARVCVFGNPNNRRHTLSTHY
jgi:hypothetical protein